VVSSSTLESEINTLERVQQRYKGSQAARQGLAMLMASAVVVLKHETSTLRQSHNFISIDLKFGVGDYVREVTSLAKFGLDPMSNRDATWGKTGPLDFSLFFNRATAHTLEQIFAHNSSKDAVWCKTLFGMRSV